MKKYAAPVTKFVTMYEREDLLVNNTSVTDIEGNGSGVSYGGGGDGTGDSAPAANEASVWDEASSYSVWEE